MNGLIKLALPLLCAAASVMPQVAQAQSASAKVVTIIVPTTPGTGSDIAARLLAPKLSKALGQSVVVENKTGASGTIGIAAVAKAAPDGNTILFVPNTMAMVSSLYKNLTWDPVTSFVPVARVGRMVVAAVVNPQVPAQNLGELVALAKSKPGQLNYGSPGNGTPHHLRTEQFKQITGINIVHVPYAGSAGAVTDLAGGQTQVGFFPLHSLLPLAHAGKLRMLATSGETRSSWTPDVPTFREAGITVLNDHDWVGVFVPKGTSSDLVSNLSRELQAITSAPDTQAQLAERGIIAWPGGPDDLGGLLKKELAEWKKVIADSNIVAD
ncbi:tripartite tricarboxylate transporter substrate binding protein [soil metagenome]